MRKLGFRLVSWNLAGAPNTYVPHRYESALDYLRESLAPDVAVLQEVRLPLDLGPSYQVFARSDTDRWGSAIAVRSLEARVAAPARGSVLDQLGSYLAFADLYPEGFGCVRLVSVHSSTRAPATQLMEGVSPALVGRSGYVWHSDLIFHGLVDQLAERPGSFIVGGDWNESPFLWDEVHGGSVGKEFFDRAKRAGWIDCTRRSSPGDVRTWFRAGDHPYQDDHVFVDAMLGGCVQNFDVNTIPAERGYSDHAALEVTFLSSGAPS